MISIQKQTWQSLTRYLLTCEHGSVQLEFYKKPWREQKIKAFIWALWVDPEARRQGIAVRLMDTAEEIARREGQPEVWLEWEHDDAIWPDENHAREIVRWYGRRGYEEKTFGKDYALMCKKL